MGRSSKTNPGGSCLVEPPRCTSCTFSTATRRRMGGPVRAGGHLPGEDCRCRTSSILLECQKCRRCRIRHQCKVLRSAIMSPSSVLDFRQLPGVLRISVVRRSTRHRASAPLSGIHTRRTSSTDLPVANAAAASEKLAHRSSAGRVEMRERLRFEAEWWSPSHSLLVWATCSARAAWAEMSECSVVWLEDGMILSSNESDELAMFLVDSRR